MKRRNTHRNRTSSTANGAAFFSWTHFAITAIAAIVLAAGLFFAASQHFNSMELGIKNAKLRSQLAELENEKRRLELSREIALTPAELKRSAKTLGFRDAGELVMVRAKPQTKEVVTDTVIEVAKAKTSDEKVVATKTVADSRVKPEAKTAGEVRSLKVVSKPSAKEVKATPDSRPRIVVASSQGPQADSRKLVKKTVSSKPTNRLADRLR
jgi:hypothetical protein